MKASKGFMTSAGLVFLISSVSFAEVKPKMDQMLGYILQMKPFIVSEEDYANPKNTKQIQETLQKMAELSQQIKHEDKIEDSAKEMMADSLHQQFVEATEVFEKGNKSYSLWLLRTNLSNCVACHTQLPAQSTKFSSSEKETYNSSFQEAEFLYIIRNFDKSMELYEKSFAEYPKNKITAQNLETAVKRKVYYYTRVKRDLPGLNKSLTKDLQNKSLPEGVLSRLQAYANAALHLNKEAAPMLKTSKDLESYAEKTLKNEIDGNFEYGDLLNNLRRLQLSGHLYEYLNQNPKTPLRPKIYYWLSFCESRWEAGLQDSLPESYLKKCILEFPKSKIAPSCLDEYRDLVTLGYTGSSGTHLPAKIKKDLEEMQKKVQSKK